MDNLFNLEKAESMLNVALDWVEGHKEVVQEAKVESSHAIAHLSAGIIRDFPMLLMSAPAIMMLCQGCFEIGYYQGRTYQDVPKVFKDALK